MSEGDGRNNLTTRRLILIGLAVVAVALTAIPIARALAIRAVPGQGYGVTNAECAKAGTCDQQALQVQANEAEIANLSLQVSLYQLAFTLAGLFGVGFTVYYAHRAWVTAEGARKDALESERRELRAYVMIDDGRAEGMDGNAALTIGIKFKNFGSTPANNVRLTYYANVLPANFQPDSIEPREFADSGREPFAPNSDRTSSIRITAQGPDVVARLQARSHKLFMWGVIDYEDIYGTPQRTTFFFAATHDKRIEDGWFSVAPCRTHNHAT